MGKIKTLRKKLKDKAWVTRELNLKLHHSKELRTFYQFECSSFFRGRTVAERNTIYYYKREAQLNRQIKFLETILRR